MQKNWKEVLAELGPQFLILLVVIFGLLIATTQIKKKSKVTLDNLSRQNPDKSNKTTKYNAYFKLLLWTIFGIFWFAGGVYNFLHFPEGNKLPAFFFSGIGIIFIGIGIWNYFREIKKIRE